MKSTMTYEACLESFARSSDALHKAGIAEISYDSGGWISEVCIGIRPISDVKQEIEGYLPSLKPGKPETVVKTLVGVLPPSAKSTVIEALGDLEPCEMTTLVVDHIDITHRGATVWPPSLLAERVQQKIDKLNEELADIQRLQAVEANSQTV